MTHLDVARRPPAPADRAPDGMAADRYALANRLFFRLYQSSNLLHKAGTRAVSSYGSTTQQWAVLGALARGGMPSPGVSVKELVAYLLLTRQNLTIVLDRLEGRGWVERVRDVRDGRSRRVRLTPAGRAEWAKMQVEIGAFYEASLGGLSAGELVQFSALLERLKDGLAAVAAETGAHDAD